MGSNIECTRPGPPRYTLIPNIMFFEFLPIVNDRIPDLDEINPKELLLSEQLELNKTYEVIITNSSGFYRLRLGDVVRVVGFYQQAPQIEFLFRSGQNLNVNAVKISEEVLFRALREAADRWSSTLKDYTAAGSQFTPSHQGLLDPHYLLFLELDGPVLTEEQTGLQDEEYASFRKLEKIAKIRVYQVKPGAFSRFRAHLLATTAVTAGQFKMPRVLKSRDRVDWFLENVRN
ncbi:jasmonoyl--L-amino acid synthetase JAR1-like [Pollicipes pollicipes]|uniref:jasmonoyl--L-amino acid synthetase JAR1-like n=1 Tax=Pollicipes pollicipes TaxID=41117 RepID=UPI0018850C39|nr:jasmonoyl--L-amino acid synthetase JAR1-like [Pollicipes pollicipes]